MGTSFGESIEKHFGDIPEPRLERTRLYELMEILVIAICGVICGADNWEEIADFGKDVAGFVDSDIFKLGTRIYGLPVLGASKDILALIKKYDIGLVIVSSHQDIGEDFRTVARDCRNAAVRCLVLPDLLKTFNSLNTISLPIPVTASGYDRKTLPCRVLGAAEKTWDEDNPCLYCLSNHLDSSDGRNTQV